MCKSKNNQLDAQRKSVIIRLKLQISKRFHIICLCLSIKNTTQKKKISICETDFHRYILILHPKKNVLMLYDDG